MFTRSKSNASKRKIEDIPLPRSSRRPRRKQRKVVAAVDVNDNIELAPIIEMPAEQDVHRADRWYPFLRKAFNREPTKDEYEKVSRVWNHIWKHTNVCLKSSDPTNKLASSSVVLLIRDHRGGVPSEAECKLLDDPHNTYIQAFQCRFGFIERCIMDYFGEGLFDFDKVVSRLSNVGWHDDQNYSDGSCQHVFY